MAFKKTALIAILIFAAPLAYAQDRGGASFYIAPSTGQYSVGDTFTASIYINTAGQSINAIQAELLFPVDKLQVVSPSAGKSVIEVWVGQPNFSNSAGTISFRGTIPNPGLNSTQGLISVVTFRVKSTGKAVIKFSDQSKILLNDGHGTNVLSNTSGSIYDLVLPPPQGPAVSSPTHPDQSRWYPNSNVSFQWSPDGPASSYSYVLDENPITTPDNIPEGNQESVSYKNVSDGIHYFHIRAYSNGGWGGVTHFAVRVDATPPAKFPINVEPHNITSSTHPIISFTTTDSGSGLDHYEVRLVPLVVDASAPDANQTFFIEAQSPYIPELTYGKYDVLVRAYDVAGNFQEAKTRLNILNSAFSFIEWVVPSNPWSLIILLALFLTSIYLSRRYGYLHARVQERRNIGVMQDSEVANKLAKLREYQKKYGQLVLILVFVFGMFLGGTNVRASAVEDDVLSPPIITTLPTHVSNNDLFYVGGKHPIPGALITIYLENAQTGATQSFFVDTDKKGDWFYSHNDFLPTGDYYVWAQAKNLNLESPPTARESITVDRTAINLGSSRISYELLYLLCSLIFGVATIVLLARAGYHYTGAKVKHRALTKEIAEAEHSIRRGFAVIRRDLERELANNTPQNEKQLRQDLQAIEEIIGKEVWDIRSLS